MNRYTPRKKRLHHIPSVSDGMKYVSIDEKTTIMVSTAISDEDARERFLKRIGAGPKAPDTYMPPKIKGEIPIGSLEEIMVLADDTNLTEIE